MSIASIRAGLKTRLETVASIGVVNDWEPLARTEPEFQRFFVAAGTAEVRGWTITRESTETKPYAMGRNLATHTMVVRGYQVVNNDASSEKAFQDLVEAVCAALRLEEVAKFGGVVAVDPPQVRLVEPRMFGFGTGTLAVHYAELSQRVAEAAAYL